MNIDYWNRAAAIYDDDIFSVLRNDRKRVLLNCLDSIASSRAIAGDFGCGTGINLPELAARFRHVHAIDLSPKLVENAQSYCQMFSNIDYRAADLSRPLRGVPPLDVILNVNVLITDSRPIRQAILDTLAKSLKPGGRLLLVVPALESVLLSNLRLEEWNRRRGASRRADKIVQSGGRETGLVKIEGVPTKHYLREEMELELETRGLHVKRVEKIEYEWDTEFDIAPRWMQAPYPWDWMFLARRRVK